MPNYGCPFLPSLKAHENGHDGRLGMKLKSQCPNAPNATHNSKPKRETRQDDRPSKKASLTGGRATKPTPESARTVNGK